MFVFHDYLKGCVRLDRGNTTVSNWLAKCNLGLKARIKEGFRYRNQGLARSPALDSPKVIFSIRKPAKSSLLISLGGTAIITRST